ncbi:cation diffusion facilitator family transporter [Solidesulfovibrio magneticus]|uniref:Magnetosome protein MamB n=1 Tax=Solidesulfovibrio magneticus (strain ATCC 700980 / DSM 13731 / RS-1) TaxID=573370 RepID=C4XPP3_SOLM1|nr:cation diffusion facilitator family transporter [Solidesulfovibrio magneticus]BAH77593.1 magnetosome protein MamB [Solidesulfovibrio magneticus RS-1]
MRKVCQDCLKCVNNVGWIGLWTSLFLAVLQGSVGVTTGSKACLAIALQSLCDIIGSGMMILTQKVSSKPANDDFPFGYGKVEFVAAAFTCLFFAAATTILTVYDIEDIFGTPTAQSDFTPFLVAVVSVIVNERMFRYLQCVAHQAKSQTILANAWASRAGMYSAAVVGLCSVGPWVGVPVLDDIGSLIVIALIAKIIFQVFLEAVRGLLDHSVNEQYEERIETIALGVAGVTDVGRIKTKQMGRKVWADVDIFVDPANTVSDGRRIADAVRSALLAALDDFENVHVNFKPVKARTMCGAQA